MRILARKDNTIKQKKETERIKKCRVYDYSLKLDWQESQAN